jgi:hypothetical protein
METYPVLKTLCSLAFRKPDDEQSPIPNNSGFQELEDIHVQQGDVEIFKVRKTC